jgi:hypothetical protein
LGSFCGGGSLNFQIAEGKAASVATREQGGHRFVGYGLVYVGRPPLGFGLNWSLRLRR